MNWITNYVRPKFDFLGSRKEMPTDLWVKDPESGEMVFHQDLAKNQFVVPSSGQHMAIRADERLKHFFDGGEYEKFEQPEVATDPLKFRDERRYTDKLKENRQKTGEQDTIHAGLGRVHGQRVTACVQDFKFMGGSLGMAAGEAIIYAMEEAVRRSTPFVLFAASGGARMQEGVLSLMLLPRRRLGLSISRHNGVQRPAVSSRMGGGFSSLGRGWAMFLSGCSQPSDTKATPCACSLRRAFPRRMRSVPFTFG